MQSCTSFASTTVSSDPFIPPVLYYKNDAGGDPLDTRTRRQAAYPVTGTTYAAKYHSLVQDYVFYVVPESFNIILGPDADPNLYPSSSSEVVMTLNYDMDLNLIQYTNSWNSSIPYNYDNPPLIDSTSFSQGIGDYWGSVTYTNQNAVGLYNTITVTNNIATVISTIKSEMDAMSASAEKHAELCELLKTKISQIEYYVTEIKPDNYYAEGDDRVEISYTVKIAES